MVNAWLMPTDRVFGRGVFCVGRDFGKWRVVGLFDCAVKIGFWDVREADDGFSLVFRYPGFIGGLSLRKDGTLLFHVLAATIKLLEQFATPAHCPRPPCIK